MREAFEKWYKHQYAFQGYELNIGEDGFYIYDNVELMFVTWKGCWEYHHDNH